MDYDSFCMTSMTGSHERYRGVLYHCVGFTLGFPDLFAVFLSLCGGTGGIWGLMSMGV
jgi:hypothetical protein